MEEVVQTLFTLKIRQQWVVVKSQHFSFRTVNKCQNLIKDQKEKQKQCNMGKNSIKCFLNKLIQMYTFNLIMNYKKTKYICKVLLIVCL